MPDIKDNLYGLKNSAFAISDWRINICTHSVLVAIRIDPELDFGSLPGLLKYLVIV